MSPLLDAMRLGGGMASLGGGVIVPPDPGDTDPDPDPGGSGSTLPLVIASHSDTVIGRMGANIHTSFTNWIFKVTPSPSSGYPDVQSAIKGALDYIGFRHVRDNFAYNQVHSRTVLQYINRAVLFVSWDLGSGPVSNAPSAAQILSNINSYYSGLPGVSVEGLNESDNGHGSGWVSTTKTYQNSLYSELHPAGVTVVAPSLAQISRASTLGSVDGSSDAANLHTYAGARIPAYHMASDIAASAAMVNGAKPRWNTECGYHNGINGLDNHASATEEVVGVYAPIQVLSGFLYGFDRQYIYELADDRRNDARDNKEKNFGLFRWGSSAAPLWSPKPAAVSLHNLSLLLTDLGAAFTPAPVRVAVDGPSDMKYALLGKRDGTYQLCLWREAAIWTPPIQRKATGGDNISVAGQTVTVRFDAKRNVKRYQPDSSSLALSERNDQSHTVSLDGSLQVLTF